MIFCIIRYILHKIIDYDTVSVIIVTWCFARKWKLWNICGRIVDIDYIMILLLTMIDIPWDGNICVFLNHSSAKRREDS